MRNAVFEGILTIKFQSLCFDFHLPQKQIGITQGEVRMRRVINYLLVELNPKSTALHASLSPSQIGCASLIQGLTARPFWDTNHFLCQL